MFLKTLNLLKSEILLIYQVDMIFMKKLEIISRIVVNTNS
jgi:hypothetical protein